MHSKWTVRVAPLLTLILLAPVTVSNADAAAARPESARPAACRPLLFATFLQPSYAVFQWSPARFDEELADMTAIGINTVILQWTVDMDARQSYYPTPGTAYPTAMDIVGPLLNAAGAHGAKVWLGLGNVYSWQAHAGDDAWLTNQLVVDERIADQLSAAYPNRFAGWYISNEVDDSLLANPTTARSIQRFFTTLSGYLHTHAGRAPVMAAPTYSGLHQSTTAFAASVRSVMGSLDVLDVQDGGGSGYIAPSDITNWFRALHDALAKTPTALWQDADMYGPDGAPMNPPALQNDLAATCGLVVARSGFSFTSQMGPADLGTFTFYEAYRDFRTAVLATT
ncbi:MAG: DUF4434 domain-containing protein [Jatrophihabitans sp.]|uniref:DUF4434 domain-containing protein n=1 Tax=Jatrophihabitans sp. TaxID=1932789 RepID=UPI003915F55F